MALFDQDPTRCKHNTVDYNIIDPFLTEIFCVRCGEVIGTLEEADEKRAQTFVTGTPRKLTDKEKQRLR